VPLTEYLDKQPQVNNMNASIINASFAEQFMKRITRTLQQKTAVSLPQQQ